MKKNKFKLTPEAHKQIITIATALPKLQKTDKSGTPLFRVVTKVVKGFDLPPGTLVGGKEPDTKKNYVQKGKEPLLVNHEVNMVSEYKLYGQKGIDDYRASILAVLERDKKIVKEIQKQEA